MQTQAPSLPEIIPQPWPYDENADASNAPWALMAFYKAKQKIYREKRRRWARKIGRPYSDDISEPDPGVLDAVDEEQG